jgi:hypothetical protein
MKQTSEQKIYWGDLHSHCAISYGEGNLENAIKRASQQLDFCSVTGHAFWPDIDSLAKDKEDIKNYHLQGFIKLKKNWRHILATLKIFEKKYNIKIFPSYEWHSLKYGDHNIYSNDFNLKLLSANNINDLKRKLTKNNLVIPHHIGYGKNKRGINWDFYSSQLSPFVEIFSMHGCSINEDNPFTMLHDMGTLTGNGTAISGWSKNKIFGVVGSTDHHGGYPGSFGQGRMAVISKNNSKKELWNAFKKRRVYAATGDKINIFFTINNMHMGSEIKKCKNRSINIEVSSISAIESVILFKNDKKYKVFNIKSKKEIKKKIITGSIEVAWGWGKKNSAIKWNGKINLEKGIINDYQTCFRGIPKLEPNQKHYLKNSGILNELKEIDGGVQFKSITTGNYSLKDPAYQSFKIHISSPLDDNLKIFVNKKEYTVSIKDLAINGSQVFSMKGWLSELIKIGPFNHQDELYFSKKIIDSKPIQKTDRYRVEVIQNNGERAWSSPIWVSK